MELASAKVRRAKRSEYMRCKKNIPCMDCGGVFPDYCMDFHHLDENAKNPYIGRKSFVERMSKFSIQRIDEEISKCVIVCANCHRIRHHG